MHKFSFLLLIYILGSINLSAQDSFLDNISFKDQSIEYGFITSIDSSYIKIILGKRRNKKMTSYAISDVKSLSYCGQTYMVSQMSSNEIMEIQKIQRKLLTSDFLNNKTTQPLPFIQFQNGDFLFQKSMKQQKPNFSGNYFLIENKRLDYEYIRFIGDGINQVAFSELFKNKNYYAFRTVAGEYNIYSYTLIVHSTGSPISDKGVKNYFNTGFEDLQKLKYKNLPLDIINSEASAPYLAEFKRHRKIQNTIWISSLATAFGGFIIGTTASIITDDPSGAIIGFGCLITGSLSSWISVPFREKKNEDLRNAIKAYNQQYIE